MEVATLISTWVTTLGHYINHAASVKLAAMMFSVGVSLVYSLILKCVMSVV